MTILKEYLSELIDKQDGYELAEAYYNNDVAETLSDFGSAKLRFALRATRHRGSHNYCRVVVDSVLNRLEIANIVSDKPSVQKKINEIWRNNELHIEADEIHRTALSYGDAYVMAWPGSDGDIEISYHSPKNMFLEYDPESPRKKLYAVKVWKQSINRVRLNIYTNDSIYKYYADTESYTAATNWIEMSKEENPFGEIPVFHFRTHRPYGIPEHLNAYGPQNDINKLLATHMFTVDYQGAPQRYALAVSGDSDSIDFGDNETERENLGTMQASPGDVWFLTGINKVGEFKPADPQVFWGPIKDLKQSMATLTDTPYHFLSSETSFESGDALRVSEAPLMKKVKQRQDSFSVSWVELFTFILKIEGFVPTTLEVKWEVVESMDELNEWDIAIKKLNAGLSKSQVLRERGYSDEEIERIFKEAINEKQLGLGFSATNRNAATSTDDNSSLVVNAATDASKSDGGHPTDANTATSDAAKKSSNGQVNN